MADIREPIKDRSRRLEIRRAASPCQESGVVGVSDGDGTGVWGEGRHGEGVRGVSHGQWAGVTGFNDGREGAAAPGVWGESELSEGVHGSQPRTLCRRYRGNQWCSMGLTVDGDILMNRADCAEEFEVLPSEKNDPGTVMVIHHDGVLQQSTQRQSHAMQCGRVTHREPLVRSLERRWARDRSPVNTGTVMDNNSTNVSRRYFSRFAVGIDSNLL
jgi:hypothetical protein